MKTRKRGNSRSFNRNYIIRLQAAVGALRARPLKSKNKEDEALVLVLYSVPNDRHRSQSVVPPSAGHCCCGFELVLLLADEGAAVLPSSRLAICRAICRCC